MFDLLFFSVFPFKPDYRDYNGNKRQGVGDGHKEENAVKAEKCGKNKNKRHTENDFAQNGKKVRQSGFSRGLQKYKHALIHTGNGGKAQQNSYAFYGKLCIVYAFVFCTEQVDKRRGEKFKNRGGKEAYNCFGDNQFFQNFKHAAVFLCAYVIAHNRDTTRAQPYRHGNNYLKKLHNNSYYRRGNLRIV